MKGEERGEEGRKGRKEGRKGRKEVVCMIIYIRMIVLTDERVILSIVLKTNTNTTRLQHAHIDTPTDGIESSSRQTSTVR